MIAKFNFIKIFHNLVKQDKLIFNFSIENEEGFSEFQVIDVESKETLFYTYDNRIYINCSFDCDTELIGNFESINGETKEITLQYDRVSTFVNDLSNLLTWYDCNR